MNLAKPRIDIGFATNNAPAALAFWQNEIGLPFEYTQPIRRGYKQHRHDLCGSILKINQVYEPIPDNPPSGYRELLIARDGIAAPKPLVDPDGNRVALVPRGMFGIERIGIRLGVRDLEAHRRFYTEALGLPQGKSDDAGGAMTYLAGDTVLITELASDAPHDASFEGKGWRYITFQVFEVDREHAYVLAHGGLEARAPVTLGTTARISMVRDPDGNWIELSQRASLTGSLEPGIS
ncbi:VOC family protein [Bradyrhizobium sediminis]|uniref:VOC family protein n=1 Tax=Bradyrhizobium sediminis TaxID=2840469 RepID=A0A975NEQ6_9BRAD|nr:VOC family protein [Bradyrhizobium sediminis]QWG13119.1 VOC family protein [Bradyrhizobium sediminis]